MKSDELMEFTLLTSQIQDELAYQRRRADRIEARLTALERKLDDGSSSAEEVANADYSD